jgi:pimeloyl-ACP methyl ester carboxylesterase
MATLAFERSGTGPTLVLLHGIGCSRRVWDPVAPLLAEHFDVLMVDLPGFGESKPLPAEVEPHPAALAAVVGGFLDDLGIVAPHVVGNSLGGWVALELAHLRPAASLTLLSPAGLWSGDTPRYNRVSLRASRWLTRHFTRLLSRMVRLRLGRALVLGQTHGRPSGMSADRARMMVREMGNCPGFDATMAATVHRHYAAGAPFETPVTLAFGSRDLLLRRRSRRLEQLPPGVHLETLPGCGHVPMSDDPGAVTEVITAATARGVGGDRKSGVIAGLARSSSLRHG